MTEADIFIEDYSIAIEYDRVFWHKEKLVDDIEKAKRFNSNNIPLIRVRKIGLNSIDLDSTKTIYCNIKVPRGKYTFTYCAKMGWS